MFCPKCGNTLPDGAGFCNKCGAKLAARPAAAPARPAAPAAARPAPAAAPYAPAAKRPLQGVRVAAVVLVVLMLLTAVLPWFVPSDRFSLAGNAVTGLAGLGGMVSGRSLPSVSLDGSYGLWQMFQVIGEGSKFAQYMGSRELQDWFMLFWIPFILWVLAVVLGAAGVAKTFGRSGGKAFLVWSAVVMLIATLVFWFINLIFSSYVEGSFPAGVVAGLVLSLAALVVAAASRGKAKEQALAEAERQGVAGEVG